MKILRLALLVTLLQATLVVPLLYYGETLAGLINRSTKAGSTTSFATSNSLGNTLAVADLDTDLDTVYSLVNGSLDANNLTADSVGASELADNAVASANIIDGAIVNADINASAAIAGTKLAVGAGTITFQSASAQTSLSFSNVETTMATVSITTRGGRVIFGGTIAAIVSFLVADDNANLTIRFKRDGVTQKTMVFPAIRSHDGGLLDAFPFPIPASSFTDAPTAGTYTYTITGQTADANSFIATSSSNAGEVYALELP